MKNLPTKNGFTIVELLIVIVVIGILAALVLNSFSEAQVKARNTQTMDAAVKYVKALNLYAVENGSYPIYRYPCMGAPVSSGGKCANVTDGTNTCFGHGATSNIAAFDNAVKPYMGNTLPVASDQQIGCGGKNFAGAWYDSADGKAAIVMVYLKGNVPCGTIGGVKFDSKQQQESLTACQFSFTTL
jgi:prepilin-type N-terminal cleavage/methylation domain-containing protein